MCLGSVTPLLKMNYDGFGKYKIMRKMLEKDANVQDKRVRNISVC